MLLFWLAVLLPAGLVGLQQNLNWMKNLVGVEHYAFCCPQGTLRKLHTLQHRRMCSEIYFYSSFNGFLSFPFGALRVRPSPLTVGRALLVCSLPCHASARSRDSQIHVSSAPLCRTAPSSEQTVATAPPGTVSARLGRVLVRRTMPTCASLVTRARTVRLAVPPAAAALGAERGLFQSPGQAGGSWVWHFTPPGHQVGMSLAIHVHGALLGVGSC